MGERRFKEGLEKGGLWRMPCVCVCVCDMGLRTY